MSIAEYFSSGADDYVSCGGALWEPLGRRVAAAAALRPGDKVLDACAGSGACAIAAASAVGADGAVDAVDLAGPLLAHARRRAKDLGLSTIDFHLADVTTWVTGGYDAMLCGFGVFFLPAMDSDTDRLIRLVRPGGRVAFSVWAAHAMKDFVSTLLDVTQPERTGNMAGSAEPADRLARPMDFLEWLKERGLNDVGVQAVTHRPPLDRASAWSLVVGTGFRALLPPDTDRWPTIEREFAAALRRTATSTFVADCLIGTGTVPAPA